MLVFGTIRLSTSQAIESFDCDYEWYWEIAKAKVRPATQQSNEMIFQ